MRFEILKPMTPAERLAMLRSVVGLLLVSLAAVTLNMPAHTALATAVILTVTANLYDAMQATAFVSRLVVDVIVASAISVLTLVLWTDQPWFQLPFAGLILMLLFYYSRLPGGSPFPAVFYVVAIAYAPTQVVNNVYSTLDNILIILLAGGVLMLTHVALWPRRPLFTLQHQTSERLRVLAQLLEDPANVPDDALAAGQLSNRSDVLQLACKSHPDLRVIQGRYRDFIHAIETGISLTDWLQQPSASPLPDAMRPWMKALADYCRQLANHNFLWHLHEDDGFPHWPAEARCHHEDERGHWLEHAMKTLHSTAHDVLDTSPRPTERLTFTLASEVPCFAWIHADFWRQPTGIPFYFGLKYALGILICLLLIQALEWQGIDTAMVTCLVIAQASLGADYKKSLLRIMGASIGGVLALFYMLVMLPALETIAGFLLAITPAYLLASRVMVDPRFSYMGVQIGYSFAAVALLSTGPVVDLTTSRDRVLGILIGICVMGVLDYLIWPHSAARQISAPLKRSLIQLAQLARQGLSGNTPAESQPMAEQVDRELRTASDWLRQSTFEPLSAAKSRISGTHTIRNLRAISKIASLLQMRAHLPPSTDPELHAAFGHAGSVVLLELSEGEVTPQSKDLLAQAMLRLEDRYPSFSLGLQIDRQIMASISALQLE